MIKCISIDDEPLAHKIVANYCNSLGFIEVVSTFKGAVDAFDFLNNNEVDLIFLDINMPVLKGLDFLRTLGNPPMVIITSAYQEYALESFELNVIDYLLKPFAFERFLKAVNKAEQFKRLRENAANESVVQVTAKGQSESIFVKSDKKTHQISLDEIQYLESAGSYVKIHLENELIMTLERLINFEKSLPAEDFIRVHKSFIVPIKKIRTVEGNRIKIGDQQIPIGQVYKMYVNRLLRS